MKKLLVYCSMVFVVAMAVVAVSAAPADFSGTWVLDPSKSTQPQGPGGGGGGGGQGGEVTLDVKQDAKTLTSTRKTPRGEQVTTYNLDGSETTSETQRGKSTHKAKWQGDGKILEINTVSNFNMQGNEVKITSVSHWELTDGGKALKIHTKTETPQGSRESTQVYNKK